MICYVIGLRLTKSIHYESLWEEAGVCISLGLGLLSLLVLFIGLLDLLYPWVMITALAALTASTYSVWPRMRDKFLYVKTRLKLSGTFITVVILLIFSIPLFLLPLYPPKDWDAISYHLAAAKIYILNHGIVVTPYLRFPVFPQFNEMLMTMGLLIYDDILAQLLEFLMLMTLCAAVVGFGQRLFSRRAGYWSAAILVGNPIVIWLGSIAYVDMALMLFTAMSTFSLWNWLQSRQWHWLILSAIFCGFAVGTKYSAFFFLGVLGFIVLYNSFRERNYTQPLIFFALASLVPSGWYIRNYYHTGNPFFPFFGSIFGLEIWSLNDLGAMHLEMSTHGAGKSFSALLMLPWNLVFNRRVFHTPFSISSIYLISIPFIAYYCLKNRKIRNLLFLSCSYILFWFYSVQVLRYIVLALPVLSIVAAASFDRFFSQLHGITKNRYRKAISIALGVLFVLQGIFIARDNSKIDPLPINREMRHVYFSKYLPLYPAINFLNTRNQDNYTVYTLFDSNMAYFADGVFIGDWFGPARYHKVLTNMDSGNDLYEVLRLFGADYFLLQKGNRGVKLPGDEFFQEHFKTIDGMGAKVLLFELLPNQLHKKLDALTGSKD